MPGLIGFTKPPDAGAASLADQLRAARARLKNGLGYFVDDPVFENEVILAARTHLGFVGESSSPQKAARANVWAWVEGEANGLEKLGFSSSLGQTIAESCAEDRLEKTLEKIDGYFAAIVWDEREQKIHLISDRLGMKPLYWFFEKNKPTCFGWASEAKAFLSIEAFSKTLNLSAGEMLLDLGHLVGDETWFKNARLLDAATILTFSLKENAVSKRRYWTWQRIKPISISFGEAAEELGAVLKKAVQERFSNDLRNGISLSGGLDSRAILASAAAGSLPARTFSYGELGCDDLRIAEAAAALAKAPNERFFIDETNWMAGRQRGAIANDGQYSWLHLHWAPFARRIRANCQLNHSGFAGDLVMGGGYVSKLDARIDARSAQKKFGRWAARTGWENSFFDIEKQDAFFIDARVRRFTRSGSVDIELWAAQRKPFVSNAVIELVHGLPDSFRLRSKLYSKALMSQFPAFFDRLAWQKTGIPISQSMATKAILALKIRQIQSKAGFFDNRSVHYGQLARSAKAVEFFRKMLSPKLAVYPDFFERDFEKEFLDPHLSGFANEEKLGRAIALETWLRYIFAPERLLPDDAD